MLRFPMDREDGAGVVGDLPIEGDGGVTLVKGIRGKALRLEGTTTEAHHLEFQGNRLCRKLYTLCVDKLGTMVAHSSSVWVVARSSAIDCRVVCVDGMGTGIFGYSKKKKRKGCWPLPRIHHVWFRMKLADFVDKQKRQFYQHCWILGKNLYNRHVHVFQLLHKSVL